MKILCKNSCVFENKHFSFSFSFSFFQVSAFADDLAIALSHPDKDEAQRRIQNETDKVARWSRKWQLSLNKKCEACLFTTATGEAQWKPEVRIEEEMIPHNKTPTFLGITYDTQLTFEKHVNTVVKKMEQRSGLLARLGGVDWGWSRESMRTIYSATQRSLAEYAAPAWAPWISKTNQMKIERAQLRLARSKEDNREPQNNTRRSCATGGRLGGGEDGDC